MIEESGENWWYISEGKLPSIEVSMRVTTHDEWSKERRRRKKAKKPKKPVPFGFGRELKRKRGRT